ncbi:MAG: ATP-binding protein [Protaetiibacter sp.]
MTDAALWPDELLDALLARIREVPRPVVLIDGGSGSGKSTLAGRLAPRLGAQLVRLDDVYPGWDGLEAASAHLVKEVLGDPPRWRRWDWAAERPAEWHELDPARPLVVEGSGSLSRAARERADLAIWIELDAAERKRRALARDGDGYAPHWERWAAQEAAFRARERPELLADVVIDESRIAT